MAAIPGKLLKHEFEGFYRAFTIGDGSCFFHSLAHILNLDDYDTRNWREKQRIGHELRRNVVQPPAYRDWLRERGFDPSIPGIPTYEEAVDPKRFANECIINFTASRLGVSLVLVRNRNEAYVRRSSPSSPLAILAWVNDAHFEPILRVRPQEGSTVYVPPPFLDTVCSSKHLLSFDCPILDGIHLL